MAADSDSILFALPSSTSSQVHEDTGLLVDHSVQIAVCSLCQKALSPENEMTSDLATNGVCGDCKFLLHEDFENHTQSSQRSLRRRFRHSSSESVENISSQPCPHSINNLRQNQSTTSADDDQLADGYNPSWSLQYASTHTTPSGSGRWRRVFSDTDSDGFDNWSCIYGDNESNASFRRYRVPHVESDSLSFSAYGGDSDISMDGHSFTDTGMFNLPDVRDDFDSDTDIDPMHAGPSQWNSDDMEDYSEEEEEEEEGEEEREWDIAVAEEPETTASLQIFFTSSPSENSGHVNWQQRLNSTESEGTFSRRIRHSWQAYNDHSFNNLDDGDLPPYGANMGDYLDARQTL